MTIAGVAESPEFLWPGAEPPGRPWVILTHSPWYSPPESLGAGPLSALAVPNQATDHDDRHGNTVRPSAVLPASCVRLEPWISRLVAIRRPDAALKESLHGLSGMAIGFPRTVFDRRSDRGIRVDQPPDSRRTADHRHPRCLGCPPAARWSGTTCGTALWLPQPRHWSGSSSVRAADVGIYDGLRVAAAASRILLSQHRISTAVIGFRARACHGSLRRAGARDRRGPNRARPGDAWR